MASQSSHAVQEAKEKQMAALFSEVLPKATPKKKQSTLDFTATTPDAKKAKIEEESQAYKKAREAEITKASQLDEAKREMAQSWGLTWPKPAEKARKGGPIPRARKWKEGLYQW
eukprot:7688557-Karenia_brevis.AAC.1